MKNEINITLVRNEGCVHCAQTKELLKKLQPEYPKLKVSEIDIATPEGQKLISRYSIMSSPGIIINDELFAMGGTTEKDLRSKFEELKQQT